MIHPLIDNLKDFKEAELESKVSELSKKYYQTNNPDLKHQIAMLLDMYRAELQARRSATWDKLYQNRDKGLDKLINID